MMQVPTYQRFRTEWDKRKGSFPPEVLAKLLAPESHAIGESRVDTCRRACGIKGYDTVDPRDRLPWKPLVEQYNKWLKEGEEAKPGERVCACGCGLRMPYSAPAFRKYLNSKHAGRAARQRKGQVLQGPRPVSEGQDDPLPLPHASGYQIAPYFGPRVRPCPKCGAYGANRHNMQFSGLIQLVCQACSYRWFPDPLERWDGQPLP